MQLYLDLWSALICYANSLFSRNGCCRESWIVQDCSNSQPVQGCHFVPRLFWSYRVILSFRAWRRQERDATGFRFTFRCCTLPPQDFSIFKPRYTSQRLLSMMLNWVHLCWCRWCCPWLSSDWRQRWFLVHTWSWMASWRDLSWNHTSCHIRCLHLNPSVGFAIFHRCSWDNWMVRWLLGFDGLEAWRAREGKSLLWAWSVGGRLVDLAETSDRVQTVFIFH